MVPELIVDDLDASLVFYAVLGFRIDYQRPAQRFAYLTLGGGVDLMLEQVDEDDRLHPGSGLVHPYGRGTNLSIDVEDVAAVRDALVEGGHRLLHPLEERWYERTDDEVGVLELTVADPDGYLLRPTQHRRRAAWPPSTGTRRRQTVEIGGLQQRPPQAPAAVRRVDGELLDVNAAVDHVDQQVADGDVALVRDHPRPTIPLVRGEHHHRQRLVVGDGVHPDPTEQRAGGPLDVSQRREVLTARRSDDVAASVGAYRRLVHRTAHDTQSSLPSGSARVTQRCGPRAPS